MKNDVIIIGGGIGGICCGIYLLNKGFKVTIVEKNKLLGGKINIIEDKGFKFDLTASILMTSRIYTDIFEEVGKDYKDYFKIRKLETLYKVFYHDKEEVVMYDEQNKLIDELDKMEKGLGKDFMKLLSRSYEKYFLIKNDFIDKPMINLIEVLNIHSIKSMVKVNPLSTTKGYVKKRVRQDKIINYLMFTAMYMGIDPYKRSNIFTLIPAISHFNGLWYIDGGMYSYIKALNKLFIELGGQVINNMSVESVLIEHNKVKGVKSKNKTIYGDIVICNSDYSYTIENLIKDDFENKYNKRNLPKKEYSCSVIIIYLGLDKIYENLDVHNIYINKDFEKSIRGAFEGYIPDNPSLYMYYPSCVDRSFCNGGKSSLNIMLRIPNLHLKNLEYDTKDINKIRNIIIDTVKQIPYMEDLEEHIVYENYLTPKDLKNKFNCYYGNAFGLSHKLLQNIYFRPHIKSKKVEGLYFLNASTHPGNGASVIMSGSKVLSNLIYNDYKNCHTSHS